MFIIFLILSQHLPSMVFSSLTFLFLFLPLNLLLYFATGNLTFRNIVLVVFSLIFYAWGEPFWILLLLFSAFFDFFNGRAIEAATNVSKKRLFLTLSVVVNLGLLVVFKYSGFIYDNLNLIFQLPFQRPENTLPIGISFYTFQTLSYVIDVYRGDVKAQKSPLKFLMFVSLFHQLVAGPIVRYKTIEKDIERRNIDWQRFGYGVQRFCFGLFKKVIIANTAGELVDYYLFEELSMHGSYGSLFGLFMFAVQIYFDFSGYSDMAIGLGRMFGFNYDENFKHPYAANSVTDFWRRWHISLGTFFRDYVYIPLGGNRQKQIRNLLVVWSLTGLWHGASWNYVLWGLYFFVLLFLEKNLLLKIYGKIIKPFRILITLILVVYGWSFFYFEDMNTFLDFNLSLFSGDISVSPILKQDIYQNVFWLLLVLFLCIPWDEIVNLNLYINKNILALTNVVATVFLFLISVAYLVGSSYNPFLYFRF